MHRYAWVGPGFANDDCYYYTVHKLPIKNFLTTIGEKYINKQHKFHYLRFLCGEILLSWHSSWT